MAHGSLALLRLPTAVKFRFTEWLLTSENKDLSASRRREKKKSGQLRPNSWD
jgi:hypothetical protein